MFHSFFNSLPRSKYLSLFSHSFNFTLWSAGTVKSTILQVFSFLLIIIRSGCLAEIGWSVCIIVIIYSLEFFTWVLADGFSMEFEWQQVSRTLPSILTVLINVVVWMVSTCPPTCKTSSPFSNSLLTNAPITIGIIVTCMFHSFFHSLARSRYLSFFSHSFSFILWSAVTAKSTILNILFFFVGHYKVWSSGWD